MDAASYTDLFAGGLGLDLGGAYVLAKGQFAKPQEFAKRLNASRNSLNWANVRAADERADSRLGVSALFAGFFLQATGYVLQIGGISSRTGGTCAYVVAGSCALAGTVVAVIVARPYHWPLVRDFLIELARWDSQGTRHDLPEAEELLRYADVLGRVEPQDRGDSTAIREHAWRVWRIRDVRTRT
jgi:hypothetical protein